MAGYFLFRYLDLHIESYIILCAVLVLELSTSTICVFAISPKNKRGYTQKLKADIEEYSPSKTNDEITVSNEESMETASVGYGLKGKPLNTSSMISGSTAASMFSR